MAIGATSCPALGRKRLRRLRPEDLERLYDSMLDPTDGRRALAPKTVYEVHLVIRGALDHAVRRGLVSRNVALAATAPKMPSIAKIEQRAWTAKELQGFLRAAAGHRLFPAMTPAPWNTSSPEPNPPPRDAGKPVEHPGEHHRDPVERTTVTSSGGCSDRSGSGRDTIGPYAARPRPQRRMANTISTTSSTL